MDPDLKYERRLSKETRYFQFEQLENISFDYEMGINKYGTIVFRYPNKALERLKTGRNFNKAAMNSSPATFPEGIEAVRKAFDLPELDSRSFRLYKTYGWQLIDADATAPWRVLEQGRLISRVLDIYENSFYKNFQLRNS